MDFVRVFMVVEAIFTLITIAIIIRYAASKRRMGDMHEQVADAATTEKKELAAELRKQTSGLAQMISSAGQKADDAYHESNELNAKIARLTEEVRDKLSDIEVNAETARIKATDVSEKADVIDDTGKDTNERVRNIQEGNH